jgi:hypothetical protein
LLDFLVAEVRAVVRAASRQQYYLVDDLLFLCCSPAECTYPSHCEAVVSSCPGGDQTTDAHIVAPMVESRDIDPASSGDHASVDHGEAPGAMNKVVSPCFAVGSAACVSV